MKKLTFDDEYLRLVAMDMACYLSWLEEFEDRTLDPTKMKSLIKKFFQFEKKGGHIKTFNETDINGVAILVFTLDPNKIKKFRKKNGKGTLKRHEVSFLRKLRDFTFIRLYWIFSRYFDFFDA